MKKQVMVRAWELARQGAKKFGGKVVDFFRSALAIAWKEAKSGIVVTKRVLTRSEVIAKELKVELEVAENLVAVEKALQTYYAEDDEVEFKNWKGLRVYFTCPWRSKNSNSRGNYYDIKSGKLVDRYVKSF